MLFDLDQIFLKKYLDIYLDVQYKRQLKEERSEKKIFSDLNKN